MSTDQLRILAKPGDLSGWIDLADAARKYLGAASEELREASARELDGVAVKVRVLDFEAAEELRAYSRWIAQAQAEDLESTVAKRKADAHLQVKAIETGLGEVRGLGVEQVTQEVAQAMAASGYSWIVSRVVLDYQDLPVEERAGFFTLEAAASN